MGYKKFSKLGLKFFGIKFSEKKFKVGLKKISKLGLKKNSNLGLKKIFKVRVKIFRKKFLEKNFRKINFGKKILPKKFCRKLHEEKILPKNRSSTFGLTVEKKCGILLKNGTQLGSYTTCMAFLILFYCAVFFPKRRFTEQ